ncbi:carbohydrate ABC transporter membrane protein 2, CUT1 family [Clostridium collagenovorans DSM 3089]|uniref:Carbohydrate ABC transporter membrane protein 2, CUT1 family n=1 Tax=Clostridium collagenovorans DSM 3089 TaxID=1121306 RepID=A0A1M5WML2_9CLOT|nr:carbohydrate ABC transporter permease [Clostridium collagenovorans]SHH88820.1 carbohydrate ABC transporter membrane protein 2, CUT1 family [Clostridium collagenovorans DSM 3089]
MKKKGSRIFSNTILLILAGISVIPFVYMIITSLKVTYNSFDFSISLSSLTLSNYVEIFSNKNFGRYFLNSAFISVSGVILTLVFSSLAGYAFAKLEFKGNDKIFLFIVLTMIVPAQVTMVPLYIIMKYLGWLNTYWALIIPIPSAFGVFIMRQAILNVPKELLESAKIDGYSDLKILIKIVIPLVKPALITLSIFTFMGAWNSFLWPLVVTTKDAMRTLPLAMSTMQLQHINNYGSSMASATIGFLPPFIFYLILQRKFVDGVSLSGIKG